MIRSAGEEAKQEERKKKKGLPFGSFLASDDFCSLARLASSYDRHRTGQGLLLISRFFCDFFWVPLKQELRMT